MDETTFENAKVGDKVWTIDDDWGTITQIDEEKDNPIVVEFEFCQLSFTIKGFRFKNDKRQSLFWDELKYEIPIRPLRKIIKKINVWANIFPDDKILSYQTKEAADICKDTIRLKRIACVKLTGEYEVEE